MPRDTDLVPKIRSVNSLNSWGKKNSDNAGVLIVGQMVC